MKKAKMKNLVLLILPFVVPLSAFAQSMDNDSVPADSVALSEIVVRSSRMNNKDGALRVIPTKEQQEASATGYSLLSKLALPYVKVNEVTKEITVQPNLGQIQVRVNDVVADRSDLMALDVKSVKYVDYIKNPGVRYGKDVDFVINIVVRRPDNGYAVGADVMQTLTSMRSSGDVFAKYNVEKAASD